MSEEKEVEIIANDLTVKKQSFFSRLKAKRQAKKEKKLQQIEIQQQQLSEEEKKVVKEKVEVVEKEVKESSGKKKKILKICYFIFNILLVTGILVWNILSTDDFSPLNLLDINIEYVFVVLAFLILIIVIDVLTIHKMIYKKTMRSRWHLSYKSFAVLRYYDAVTPMNSGGQPFMASYMMGRDVPASTALSIPVAKLVFQQIAWLILTFVCLIVSFTNGIMSQTGVAVTSIIGFVIVCGIVSLILIVSLSRRFGQKLVSWVVGLLVKIRILRDYDKYYEKVMRYVDDYRVTIKEYTKSVGDTIYHIIMHILRFAVLFSIPYFIYLIFPAYQTSGAGNYWDFFIYTALIDLSSSFIPLPGGTGMNEITFAALFSSYLGGNTFWALLLWRFCSYYFYLLQGLAVMSYDAVYGNRKYRWVKKRLSLQSESQEFRKLQIENFRSERNKRRKKQRV